MLFFRLSEYFQRLEETALRNKMTEILAELFMEAEVDEIGKLCYLLQGRVAPLFTAVEFGMGEKMVIRGIADGVDLGIEKVEKQFKASGDLGIAVERIKNHESRIKNTFMHLTINNVYDCLYQLATSGGEGSQDIKIKLLGKLIRSTDPISAKYIVKITIAKLRLGFSDMTILDSLSWMLTGSKKLKKEIEEAYNVRPDIGFISQTLKEKGIDGLSQVKPAVGTPILMARAERMSNGEDIILKIGKCAIESKYDGFRCIAGYTPLYIKTRGYISVRDVKIGDFVLTHKGKFRRILAKNKRIVDKKEKVFKLHTYLGDPVKVSEGHPLLVWENNKTKWKGVEQIKTGDYVVFPRPLLSEFSKKGLINPHFQLIDESGYKKEIPADNNFFRLLGFWIGDGFTNEFHNTERVGLFFNAKSERSLADEYKKIILSVLNIPVISESIHNGSLSVYWRDKPFRIWLSKYFCREWKGKMIPEWFSYIGKEQLKSFLRGWIESDGTPTKSGGYRIVTKERDLAALIQLICFHHGIPAGLHKIRAKIKIYNFVGTYYELILPGTSRYIKVKKDNIIVRVLRNEEIKRDPRLVLYNLQVEEDESYTSGLLTLHNCQIHKKNNEIKIFSRNLENTTSMYPDIVEGIRKQIKTDGAILEGEAIGINLKTGEYLPFQETVQRKRKYDIEIKAKEIPLHLFAFDCLYVNGKSLMFKSYMERRKILSEIILKGETIHIAHEEVTDNSKRIEEIFMDATTKGLEGVMAKKLNGTYKAGARGFNWIKYKKSYASKLADTIDCVVMGYDYGQGKRQGFGIGDFLIGIRDEKREMFATVAKIGTGLTDIEWKTLRIKNQELRIKDKPKNYDVDKMMGCDVWVEPQIVVEIRADEITRSPVHTAGRIMIPTKSGNAYEVKEAGFALRFPRLERFREDKNPKDVTSLKELSMMYKEQEK